MSKTPEDAFEALHPSDRRQLLDLMRRGANRRDVLAMLGVGGMSLASSAAVLGGATRAVAAEPRRGGSIRVCGKAFSTAETLDPALSSSASDHVRCHFFYNGLTRIDEAGAPQPELAESFESRDARIWVFKLRKGVTFHDGKSLTSRDVLFSLQRHLDPATGSKVRKLAARMVEISARGDDEIRIILDSANAEFPSILAIGHFLIVQDGTRDFSKGVGTGPFRLADFQPGVRAVAVRNESYWRNGGPCLDRIEFVGLAESQARVDALMSGGVQLAASIHPHSLAAVEDSGAFDVLRSSADHSINLILRLDEGPGRDPDFVLGMKSLMNRDLICSAICHGYAEIGNDQPLPSSNRFKADLPQRAFDPDRAKFHFARAGVLGTTIPVLASPAADHSVEIAMLMQREAGRLGLTLDVQRIPAQGDGWNHGMASPVGFDTIHPGPTADLVLSRFFLSGADRNGSRWTNETFDKLVVGARAEMDETRRKELYHDTQQLIHDEAGVVIPAFIPGIDVHSTSLKGLKPMPTGPLMGHAFGEFVWLEGAAVAGQLHQGRPS